MSNHAQPQRIQSLDVVRGVAVMGILGMNILAFALPYPATINPAAYGGDSGADLIAWFATFVLVEGKMRALFSILFGASTLLVIDRAEASGRNPVAVHFARMAVLLLFGLAHFYLVWFGDILTLYALSGMIIVWARHWSPLALAVAGVASLTVYTLMLGGLALAAMSGDATMLSWIQNDAGANSPRIAAELVSYARPWTDITNTRLTDDATYPIDSFLTSGWEAVGLMLIGMALFKSGMFTGGWPRARLLRWAIACLAIAIPPLLWLAWSQVASGFDTLTVFGAAIPWSQPFDIVLAIGFAALLVLWSGSRSLPALKARVAAAGRMAFTNYLATSLVMTTIFYGYGLGLFGQVGRANLWWFVAAMCLAMLAWSKPWLDQFHYGPLEWLWRSMSRGALQPLRRG
ncbi:DUF418 domain-containing protein [Sphingomonas sp. LY160]|uniref:DUF418 domain-containing protein n=1 Tax=Sphingomonas sp. LY160 TaxID=3095342 RepID=UPI002ADEAC46|nr:DUF418 domain-containing protein [Sphingomonas sp. LY160]MEA1071934.1 DUF418 domain-containing protein [Sphingomonas sp. LY160]